MSIAVPVESPRFRAADAGDAQRIAVLHADSWRRHYRGAYTDAYLDGDVAADRRTVWSARLAAPAGTETILAEIAGRLAGFVHVVFDEDPVWGSFVDNLHVAAGWHRRGIGTALLTRAADAIADRATSQAMYLWVLEQNASAQQFYRACGAVGVQTAVAAPPGGDPARLNGAPGKLRMAWPQASRLNRHDGGR